MKKIYFQTSSRSHEETKPNQSLLGCSPHRISPQQRLGKKCSYITMLPLGILLILGCSLKSAGAIENTKKYEDCLNEIKTLSGEFTQINNKGHKATGTIQISRPGKMRLDYNPPSFLLIVSDGKWLITYDRQADETNYVSLENTPAAFLLRPRVRFKGDVAITSVIPKGDTTEISLIRTDEPDSGYITLVFTDNPVSLKEWSVVDPQGIGTRVILSGIKSNVKLDPGLFAIKSPNLIQQIF